MTINQLYSYFNEIYHCELRDQKITFKTVNHFYKLQINQYPKHFTLSYSFTKGMDHYGQSFPFNTLNECLSKMNNYISVIPKKTQLSIFELGVQL